MFYIMSNIPARNAAGLLLCVNHTTRTAAFSGQAVASFGRRYFAV